MHEVRLPDVQETLLIPLLARALESQKPHGVLRDEQAAAIVRHLNYDFDKWRDARSLFINVMRTCMFDEDVTAFLQRHPYGTVVELGCGLNTRFERLDNGLAHWFEVDLPESLELRRRFFQDHPRRTMIAASLLDTSWHDAVAARPGPFLFVAEAVLIYVDSGALEAAIQRLAQRFAGGWLLTDTTASSVVAAQGRHDLMRKLPRDSWFRWECDAPEVLSTWGLTLVHSRTLLDSRPALRRCMPPLLRWAARWAPWALRRKANGYRFNLFQLTPGG